MRLLDLVNRGEHLPPHVDAPAGATAQVDNSASVYRLYTLRFVWRGRMDGWVGGWVDGWMGGWMDG